MAVITIARTVVVIAIVAQALRQAKTGLRIVRSASSAATSIFPTVRLRGLRAPHRFVQVSLAMRATSTAMAMA